MARAVGQAEVVDEPGGAAHGLGAVLPSDEGRHGDILEHRELGQQLVELEYEADVAVAEAGEGFPGEV